MPFIVGQTQIGPDIGATPAAPGKGIGPDFAFPTVALVVDTQQLSVTVFDYNGVYKTGPINNVLSFNFNEGIDKIGAFELRMPANGRYAPFFTAGSIVGVWRETEGQIWFGKVTGRQGKTISIDGRAVHVVNGLGLMVEIENGNMLMGKAWNNTTLLSALIDIVFAAESPVTLPAWSATIDVGLPNVTYAPNGISAFAALLKLREAERMHVRKTPNTPGQRLFDFGAFGVATGLRVLGREQIGITPAPFVGIITDIEEEEEDSNIVNSMLVFGGGDGPAQLRMKYSTRVAPYVRTPIVLPDGTTGYLVEDAASIAAYGRVRKTAIFKDILPISNSPASFTAADDALYDTAIAALIAYKDPPKSYTISATHINPVYLQVGNTIHVTYSGWSYDSITGTPAQWINIDADLVLMEYTRRFDENGDYVELVVSTIARYMRDDQITFIDALDDIQAFKSALKTVTYETYHGYKREAAQFSGSKWVQYPITFDDNISAVFTTKVRVTPLALKSNVTVASSGGSSTTSNNTGHSHTLLTLTQTADAAHDHNINTLTLTADAAHDHTINTLTLADKASHDHTIVTFTLQTPSSTQLVPIAGHVHQSLFLVTTVPPGAVSWEFGMYDSAGSTSGSIRLNLAYVSGGNIGYTRGTDDSPVSVAHQSHVHPLNTATMTADALHNHALVSSTMTQKATHNHPLVGATLSQKASHSHPLTGSTQTSDTTHQHDVAAHTHPLTYGIFESILPSFDYTVWVNGVQHGVTFSGETTFEIVTKVTDVAGHPNRIKNIFEIRKPTSSPDAVDFEVEARSVVSATSIVPV